MSKAKKIISVLIVLILGLSLFSFNVSATKTEDYIGGDISDLPSIPKFDYIDLGYGVGVTNAEMQGLYSMPLYTEVSAGNGDAIEWYQGNIFRYKQYRDGDTIKTTFPAGTYYTTWKISFNKAFSGTLKFSLSFSNGTTILNYSGNRYLRVRTPSGAVLNGAETDINGSIVNITISGDITNYITVGIPFVIDANSNIVSCAFNFYYYYDESGQSEKQEAESVGGSSKDEMQESMPNEQSEGVINAFGSLVNAMGDESAYDVRLQIPTIKIPAIPNVCDEIILADGLVIDFRQVLYEWGIPDSVLGVVQSLCTIALIIYCVKELYGWIEYVLTLRKGGNDT